MFLGDGSGDVFKKKIADYFCRLEKNTVIFLTIPVFFRGILLPSDKMHQEQRYGLLFVGTLMSKSHLKDELIFPYICQGFVLVLKDEKIPLFFGNQR